MTFRYSLYYSEHELIKFDSIKSLDSFFFLLSCWSIECNYRDHEIFNKTSLATIFKQHLQRRLFSRGDSRIRAPNALVYFYLRKHASEKYVFFFFQKLTASFSLHIEWMLKKNGICWTKIETKFKWTDFKLKTMFKSIRMPIRYTYSSLYI